MIDFELSEEQKQLQDVARRFAEKEIKPIAADLDNITDLDSVERQFGFLPRPLEENLGYIRDLSFREALAINLGAMPRRVQYP